MCSSSDHQHQTTKTVKNKKKIHYSNVEILLVGGLFGAFLFLYYNVSIILLEVVAVSLLIIESFKDRH